MRTRHIPYELTQTSNELFKLGLKNPRKIQVEYSMSKLYNSPNLADQSIRTNPFF